MAKMYYDSDGDLNLFDNKSIAIIGYGSQGHAHALSANDSGVDVKVGLYEGSKSWKKAENDGLEVGTVSEVSQSSDLIMMLLPDTIQPKVYKESIEQHMNKGKTLMFAHGFNIHYNTITPPANVDVVMVAPKAPGHRMREVFTKGSGVPGLLAIHQNPSGNAISTGLAYAKAVGCTRAGVLTTTFKEETETDLFGEQSVLCGGLSSLILAGFETLTEAGYPPEMAYFECLHEVKLIVDLIYEGGLANMRYSISNTAEYGDYVSGKRIINKNTREEMKRILDDIQSGRFARDWMQECKVGQPSFKSTRRRASEHKIEEVGKSLRSMMPWIEKQKLVDKDKN